MHARQYGGQRVSARSIGRLVALNLQAAIDVPDRQAPALLAAQSRHFDKRVVVFVGLHPQAGEACADMLGQPFRKCHIKVLFISVLRISRHHGVRGAGRSSPPRQRADRLQPRPHLAVVQADLPVALGE